MFPVSFIFNYQHIVYDFHEGVEAFVTASVDDVQT